MIVGVFMVITVIRVKPAKNWFQGLLTAIKQIKKQDCCCLNIVEVFVEAVVANT
jgi:hypothetical protein